MITTPINANDFLLSEGGPFNHIMVKMRLDNRQGKLAIAALCITWLPLVIITAVEGTFYNNTQLSFLADIAFQARVLVALQMLILMQVAVDNRVSTVIQYISGSL